MTETDSPTISVDELRLRRNTLLATSPWYAVEQPKIDCFAKLTHDEYFIHTDAERARREGPYGGTIAHGMLVLSLLSDMAAQSLPRLEGLRSAVNYGFDSIRFLAPVRSGSRVRAHFTLLDMEVRSPTRVLLRYGVGVEIEGQDRQALAADWLTLVFLGAPLHGDFAARAPRDN